MQVQSVAIVVIEEENPSVLSNIFLKHAANLSIENLALISPSYEEEAPSELKFPPFTQETTLLDKLLLIRKAADAVQQGLKGKKEPEYKIQQTTLLVHNFRLQQSLNELYEQKKEAVFDEFKQAIQEWEEQSQAVLCNYWSDQSVINSVGEFPELGSVESPEILLFNELKEAQVVLSGYLQLEDDALVSEYLKDQNFTELVAKFNIETYKLPKPVNYEEAPLFQYNYNVYETMAEYDTKEFIRLPDKPEEALDKKKRLKKHKEEGFFSADGKLMFPKVLKYVLDNEYKRFKNDEITVKTAPIFTVRECGKFLQIYNVSEEYDLKNVEQKEEKQVMQEIKTKIDENTMGESQVGKIIHVLDVITSSGMTYDSILKANKVTEWGEKTCGLKLLEYQMDNVNSSGRSIETKQKPAKGQENLCLKCRMVGLLEDQSMYLRMLEDEQFRLELQEQIDESELAEPLDLSIYSSSLDDIPFECENEVSSIVEAMILQLEAEESPEPVAQDKSKEAKRAPSAKNNEKSEKLDKNESKTFEIPFLENEFGITQKDVNILSIHLDYSDKPILIDDELIKAFEGIQYSGNQYYEVGTKMTENGLELVEIENKEEMAKEEKVEKFVEQAVSHDRRLINYYQNKVIDYKQNLLLQLKQRNQLPGDIRGQASQQHDGSQNDNQQASQSEDITIEVQDEIQQQIEQVNDYFDFSEGLFQNSTNEYQSLQQRSNLFAMLGDFLECDNSCDEKNLLFKVNTTNWQTVEDNYYEDYYFKVFEHSRPRLYQTVPEFNVFINCVEIQNILLNNEKLPALVKQCNRYFLPKLSQVEMERQEYALPLYPSAKDFLDVKQFSGNFCAFNILPSNMQEAIDELYGNIAFKHDYYTEQELIEQCEELELPSAKGQRSSANQKSKQLEESGAQSVAQSTINALVRDEQVYFFTKYTKFEQQTFNQFALDTKLVSKVALPFYELPDINIEIPSLAPQFDIEQADLKQKLFTDSDNLGLHYIVNNPSAGRIIHTVINNNCEVMKIVMEATAFCEKELSTIEEPDLLTPEFTYEEIFEYLQKNDVDAITYPERQNTENLTGKQLKQQRELEQQEETELKKRKKRALELKTQAENVKETRCNQMAKEVGKPIMGARATASKTAVYIGNPGIRMYNAGGVLYYNSEELQLQLDHENVQFTLCKEFHDINMNQLGIYDKNQSGGFGNLLLELRKQLKSFEFKKMIITYKITLARVTCSVDLTEETGANYCINLLDYEYETLNKLNGEILQDSVTVPLTFTRYQETSTTFSVVSAAERIVSGDISAENLMMLDLSEVAPNIEENARVLNCHLELGSLLWLSSFSAEKPVQSFTELFKVPSSFEDEEYYLNQLENIHTRRQQILRQNPFLYEQRLRQLAEQAKTEAFLLQLPIGVAVLIDERSRMRIVLTQCECSDFFVLERNRASFIYSDAFEVGYCGKLFLSDIKSTVSKTAEELSDVLRSQQMNLYTYDNAAQLFTSNSVALALSEANRQCAAVPRDPGDFLVSRREILLDCEIPAKSLICFCGGISSAAARQYLSKLQCSFSFTPRFLTRRIKCYFQLQEAESVALSNVVLADDTKTTLLGLANRSEAHLRRNFAEPIATCQGALLRSVPRYQAPNFTAFDLKQPSLEQNFAAEQHEALATCRTGRSANGSFACEKLPIAPESMNTVRRDVYQPIKLSGENRFDDRKSYWATPEGRAFVAGTDNSQYNQRIAQYEEMSRLLDQSIRGQQLFKPQQIVSGNLFQASLQHHRRTTLPSRLKPVKQPRSPEKQMPTLQKLHNQVDINTVIEYAVSDCSAIAACNSSYLQRNERTLAKTKTASAARFSGYNRAVYLYPNFVELNISTEEMGLLHKKFPDQSYFTIYYQVQAKNVGREPLHIRWDRRAVPNSNVFDVEILTQKGGICPGLSETITIEFNIDFDLQDGETLDAVVLKTEEEVIALPVSIFYGDFPENEELIDNKPPRCLSQQDQMIKDAIEEISEQDLEKADAGEHGKQEEEIPERSEDPQREYHNAQTADIHNQTTAEVLECEEQSVENEEEYEPVDIGDIQEMKGYGGEDTNDGSRSFQELSSDDD